MTIKLYTSVFTKNKYTLKCVQVEHQNGWRKITKKKSTFRDVSSTFNGVKRKEGVPAIHSDIETWVQNITSETKQAGMQLEHPISPTAKDCKSLLKRLLYAYYGKQKEPSTLDSCVQVQKLT